MSTRNTDIGDIQKCPGAWFLKNIHEEDKQEATYFELGSALHEGIETTIAEDLDQDQAVALVVGRIEDWIAGLDHQPLESSTRGVDTILDDGERMMINWFKWVHPDSDKRHPIYDEYHWPPRVEVPFYRTDTRLAYPVWGSIDAVFTAKSGTDGAFGIADWKSGTSRQRDSNQLHFYMYGSDLDIGRGWYHHLDRQQKRSVIQEAEPYPGDAVIIRRIQATEQVKDRLLDEQVVQFNPDWWCQWCNVRDHCPKETTAQHPSDAMISLRRSLKLARPMETIERVA